jgi:sugar O-acyltransferase (sialic acid O-acetyltransferase NeuD family)
VSDKKLVIIGYSGHAYVVIETALENGYEIVGYLDKEQSQNNPYDLQYLGFEKVLNFNECTDEVSFVLGVGDNNLRSNIANFIESKEKKIQSIINRTAQISKTAIIGEGTFVNKNAIVNSFAKIGKNSILNTGCIIEHECVLQDGVHIAPGAVLAGNVNIGKNSFVGANAVIKQGISVGENVIIGAGSVIITNVPDGVKVVGNPGRVI